MTEEERAWLRGLGYLHEEEGFICAHGDFTHPKMWNYILYGEAAEWNFLAQTEGVMFCGHTHVASIWEWTAKGVCRPKLERHFMRPAVRAESISFKMNPASRYIVNVGSVGYPRNDLCCSYGIYDADVRRVTVRRLPLDFKAYIIAMLDSDLNLPGWLYQLLLAAQTASSRS